MWLCVIKGTAKACKVDPRAYIYILAWLSRKRFTCGLGWPSRRQKLIVSPFHLRKTIGHLPWRWPIACRCPSISWLPQGSWHSWRTFVLIDCCVARADGLDLVWSVFVYLHLLSWERGCVLVLSFLHWAYSLWHNQPESSRSTLSWKHGRFARCFHWGRLWVCPL